VPPRSSSLALQRAPTLPYAFGAALVASAGLVLLGYGEAVRRGLDPALFVLAHLLVFSDSFDFALRLAFQWHHRREPDGGWAPTSVPLAVGRFTPYQMKLHQRPYALVASIHNAEDILDDFLEGLGPHRERLWVIDDASTDQTWFKLRQAGVNAVRATRNRKKPGAIKELLAELPPEIETVVVLDPDVRILDRGRGLSDLDRVVFDFQRSGAAAASPQITIRPEGLLCRLQAFEYAAAFALGRRSLGDHSVTCGVALYRRDALARVLDQHSLSVYAEDLENAVILLGAGERVYYDQRLAIETEGKRTWRDWMSQRVGWSYGLIKVFAARLEEIGRGCAHSLPLRYQYLVYVGLFSFLLYPFRLFTVGLLALSTLNGLDTLLGVNVVPDGPATEPEYFLYAYLKYTALALAISVVCAESARHWLRLAPAIPIYFFYGLAQTVPSTVGYLNWCSLWLGGSRLYRDHYQDDASVLAERDGGTR
jgi:cellulose synthase/poly-beta-1,6-N-acetylglucosamine synthase-like glycosyltransferase